MYLNLTLLGDVCLPKKGQRQSLKILHRFHFTSALRRMSVIVSMQTSESSNQTVLVACKGAPETLKGMVRKHFQSAFVKHASLTLACYLYHVDVSNLT